MHAWGFIMQKNNLRYEKVENILVKLSFLAGLALLIFFSFYQANYFGGYPYDGPFQTLFSLRRIADGDLPGRDFHFFHGNGIPFIHYPIFFIFGKSLFSSQFSESIIHFSSIIISLYVVLRYFFGSKISTLSSVAWIALSTLTFFYLPSFFSLNVFISLSTYGVRSLMPLIISLLISIYYVKVQSLNFFNSFKKSLVFVVLSPFILLLGTETGIFTILVLYLSLFVIYLFNFHLMKALIFICVFILMSIGFIFIFHLVIFNTTDGLKIILNILGDQYWYFGTYPHLFLKSYHDFTFQHPQIKYYFFVLFFSLVIHSAFFYMAFKQKYSNQLVIFCIVNSSISFLLLSSNLGYISIHYASSLIRADFILLVSIVVINLKKFNLINDKF